MGGNVRLIVDKDKKRHNSVIYTSVSPIITSHHSLWNKDSKRFEQILNYFEANKFEKITDDNIIEQYGTLYINWNKKEIHQVMSDYHYDGFYIPSIALELKGKVITPKDFPTDCYDINRLLLNLESQNISPEILCYIMNEDTGKIIDFSIYFNKAVGAEEICDVIENYREIEKNPLLLEKFNLSPNIDINLIKNKEINMIKFPIINKKWTMKTYKNEFENGEGKHIIKEILNKNL